jgi:hypothetical protein
VAKKKFRKGEVIFTELPVIAHQLATNQVHDFNHSSRVLVINQELLGRMLDVVEFA